MALTGQLNDLSLSELIEFFCNQRKTGRLKVDYALAPGVFFIKEGELVDAKIGALNGAEAIYFALTLPSAAFDFSAQVQSQRRTINDPWTRVVLEGLRRIDEGIAPSEQDPFADLGNDELDEAIAGYLSSNNEATDNAPTQPQSKPAERASAPPQTAPLSLTVETASADGAGRRKFVVAGVAAAVVLACVVAAIPLVKHFSRNNAAVSAPAPAAAQPNATDNNASAPHPAASPDTNAAPAPEAVAADDAAQTAKLAREREQRQQRERDQQRKLDEAKKAEQQQPLPSPSPAVGPKTVRVSVSYDENGHVTSASAVGSSPGAEAYASTAVRVARGRRFPAGQAGSTVVTIPIN